MRGLKVWKIIGATHWPSAFVIRHLGAISQAISGSNRPSICFLHQYTATRNIAFICSFNFFTRLYPNLGKWVVSALSKENLNNSAQKTSLAQMYTVCLVSELDIICWICSILTDSVLAFRSRFILCLGKCLYMCLLVFCKLHPANPLYYSQIQYDFAHINQVIQYCRFIYSKRRKYDYISHFWSTNSGVLSLLHKMLANYYI